MFPRLSRSRRKLKTTDMYLLHTCHPDVIHGSPESEDDAVKRTTRNSMSWADRESILLLLVLYTLQGIPLGLSGSIPIIMKENGATYDQLSVFSLVSLPFSLKLLWAPLVDTLYIPSVGRRKTWLIPVQLLCGIVMLFGSYRIGSWISDTRTHEDTSGPDSSSLTVFFLFLYILMATQDIAVDGWALTMLSRENIGYASTCNAVGQVLGYFLANQGFIILSDRGWCQRHLGMNSSLVDLSSFVHFWGVIFIVVTVVVWIGKKEVALESARDHPESIHDTYSHIISIFRLKTVQVLVLVLLSARIPFGPSDGVSMFKFQEYGMPKADIASVSPFLLVLSLVLPAFISPYTNQQAMMIYMLGLVLKFVTSLLIWCIFQLAVIEYDTTSENTSTSFYMLFIIVLSLNEIASNMAFGAQMAFFAKVSDPSIGGTYMTLLNTVSNLGSKWPNVISLWLVPKLTYYECTGPMHYFCWNCGDSLSSCLNEGGSFHVYLDGYTVLQFVCGVLGLFWLIFFHRRISALDLTSSQEWLTTSTVRDAHKIV